jgi:hypothetical protein
MTTERRRIDVHHHIIPKHYVEWLEQSGISHAGGTHFPHWSADATIDLMDRHEIATGILYPFRGRDGS